MATPFMRRTFAGASIVTKLYASMSATDIAFSIAASTGWPGPSTDPFFVVVDPGVAGEEKILCEGNDGTTVAVATNGRGQDETVAGAHNTGAIVEVVFVAQDADEANQVTYLLGNLAAGAMLIGNGSGALPTVLAPGTEGQTLTVVNGSPAWA